MMRRTLKGHYVSATGHVSRCWGTICDHHEDEVPGLREFSPGSFNIRLREPTAYVPPRDQESKEAAKKRPSGGNYVSRLARVVELNGKSVVAYLYRGGHGDDRLELLSRTKLSEMLSLAAGDEIVVIIEEEEKA